jgi:ribosomal protein S18 acetylase RimI-like enzyme
MQIKMLEKHEWASLRDIRLAALREDPDEFLSTYDLEVRFDHERWLYEFNRGQWFIALTEVEPVGLIGVTREIGSPPYECYLEQLWVDPEHRQKAVASNLVREVLWQLSPEHVRTVFLWLLEDSVAALRLFQGFGFAPSGLRQPVPGGLRFEERMKLNLQTFL